MISIQTDDFDPGSLLETLQQNDSGALVSFTGLVRDLNLGSEVTALHLEHYPGMTEKALRDIQAKATQRWHIADSIIIHRTGTLQVGARIVFVAVASPHRKDAFAACEFIMDQLKTQAPFWKKELTTSGETRWLDCRESDQQAAQKWHKS